MEKLGYYPQRRFLTTAVNPGGGGSGAIIDPRGYVLTAGHVVARAQNFGAPVLVLLAAPVERMRQDTGMAHSHPESARQGLGQVEYEATIIAYDRASDLALLKIHSETTFPYIPLAAESRPKEGDAVFGFAIPDGASHRIQSWTGTVTGRNHSQFSGENVFFVDYLIKPGYSGGPVCNLKGEVIGQSSALVAISHPNIDSEIPGRTSVCLADRQHPVMRPLRQRPTLESRPGLEWVEKQGWRFTETVPKALADIGVEAGDVIVWATHRRCDRYGVEDGRIVCIWDEKKTGVWDVSANKEALGKAMENAGVGGWLLLRLARGGQSRVAQVRIQGT
ncbi:serine protease [bacterium]|nr:serine protease [bacterium]